MSYFCFEEGAFLYLPGRELLILDLRGRNRARRHNCGKRHSLCLSCAFLGGMISSELAERLQDHDFTLPTPLTRQQARLWKPPTLSGDTAPPGSVNVSTPLAINPRFGSASRRARECKESSR